MTRITHYSTMPGFIVDVNSIDRNGGRQVDWSAVPDSFRSTAFTIVTTAIAPATDVKITVDPLAGNIPAGTLLYFGVGKYAYTTAEAMEGDTMINTEALPAEIASGDEATFGGVGKKSLPAGTILSQLTSGKVVPRSSATTTAIGILESSAVQDSPIGDTTGYGVIVGGVVHENLLPDYNADPASPYQTTWKPELATSGTGFSWQLFSDNTP